MILINPSDSKAHSLTSRVCFLVQLFVCFVGEVFVFDMFILEVKLTYHQFREINCFPILHDDIALKWKMNIPLLRVKSIFFWNIGEHWWWGCWNIVMFLKMVNVGIICWLGVISCIVHMIKTFTSHSCIIFIYHLPN